ncbi:MAG: DUF2141 domain-containing protein [Sphingopyxis sp.]|jgi:uncharacterized protein (DUF2141 family)|nr:DUF2141 domain-containing protein [Sphingopyxis sp.]
MIRSTNPFINSAVAGALLAFTAVSGTAAVAQSVPATSAPAAATSTLTLTYNNIADASGAVMVALYDSEAAFNGGAPVRAVMIPVSGTSASMTIEGLAAGSYAIKSFHDVDGDGQMGTNPYGMPTEPFAFSNNAMGRMGPASWADARFDIGAAPATQTISFR